MAYQNVATPRFYANYGLFSIMSGIDLIGGDASFWEAGILTQQFNLNPASTVRDLRNETHWFQFDDDIGYNFVFFLGHSMGVNGNNILVNDYEHTFDGAFNFSVNASNNGEPSYDGWSLGGFNGSPFLGTKMRVYLEGGYKCNSVAFGRYYDMPVSPNLSLTLGREYGGTKEQTSYNGSSISNTMWNKPPMWGDLGAWELWTENVSVDRTPINTFFNKQSRSGRRTWDLKFSFISDSDIWGVNQMLSTRGENISTDIGYESDDFIDGTAFNYNLLTDDNFFSQVWHRTLGGTLPFIFQPDNTNNNPDQFAICRFTTDTLKVTQSAFNVYDISVSIEEVW